MKKRNLMHFGRWIAAFVLFFPAGLKAQEENVSTWGFANTIGWKGIEVHFVAALGNSYHFKDVDDLVRHSQTDNTYDQNSHFAAIKQFNPGYGLLPAGSKTLNIHGVFVPFRKSKYWMIKRMEWHTGFEYHLSSQKDLYEWNFQPWAVQLFNRNIFYSNKLLAEIKLSKSLKLYAGPQFKFTLFPFEKLELAKIEPPKNIGFGTKYFGEHELNATRFALGYGYNAGLKIHLSCRFNFHFEYQFYSLYRIMKIGTLSNGYHGFSMGIRYKFTKPDPVEGDKEYSPFW